MDELAPRKPQGFAALSPERRREISSLGGRSVLPENRGFSRDRYLASSAGRKGGMTSRRCPEEERSVND